MKRFGFGKKEDGGSVLSLGRKNPQDDANPYAQQNDADAQSTYSRSTAASSASYGSGLPNGPKAGLPSGPRGGYAAPPPPYASPQPGPGYANDRFGTSGGYGDNRFASAASQSYDSYQVNQSVAIQQPPLRKGGYGGLGEENRGELLANARPTYVNQQRASEPVSDGYGQSALSGGSYGGGYRDDRELTEEEKARQELLNTKAQINQIRDESLQSTQRSLDIVKGALGTGRGTYETLVHGGQKLVTVDEKFNEAEYLAKNGQVGLKNLQQSVKSIWNIGSYRTAKDKERDANVEALNLQARDEANEASRRNAYQNDREFTRNTQRLEQSEVRKSSRPVDQKFMFEDSDEEEGNTQRAKEREINDNLDEIGHYVGELNALGRDMGTVVEKQNILLEGLHEKASKTQGVVNSTTAHLRQIR